MAARMHLAMIGTRGVPAAYGGFETAVEEIGKRLVQRGHTVTVYCRRGNDLGFGPTEHLGMQLVYLPSLHSKSVETLSHTALSVLHAMGQNKPDVAFVFNAANAPFVPALQLRGIPTIVHVDGLEWQRGKWGRLGKRYYRFAESTAVRHADALIADAQGIADYYADEFSVPTELLVYGAPVQQHADSDRLAEVGLLPARYHLVVARFEPENHVDMIVRGYSQSSASLPLVVVGSAPYAAEYTDRISALADADQRVRMLGGVWDQELLDQLYANALTYLHGHSVGGTNPSLLRAMGAGTSTLAYDVVFNHDVLGDDGLYFGDSQEVRLLLEHAEATEAQQEERGRLLQARAVQHYNWDDVTDGYEALARRIASGESIQNEGIYRRGGPGWTPAPTKEVQQSDA